MTKLTQEQYNKAKFVGFFKAKGRASQPVVEFNGKHYDRKGNEIDITELVKVKI